MKEVKDLLKRQNKILEDNQKMMAENVGEFIRLLKLQAAESKVSNARLDMIENSLQKLLGGMTDLGVTSQQLMDELSK